MQLPGSRRPEQLKVVLHREPSRDGPSRAEPESNWEEIKLKKSSCLLKRWDKPYLILLCFQSCIVDWLVGLFVSEIRTKSLLDLFQDDLM